MVHWQSESDLDSIRNSCDVFIPIEYINTIYSPFGWHFSRIKFADFSLRGVGGGTSKLALLPPLTHTKKNPPIKELHSFQIPNCAPDTWKRKAACRFIIIVTITIGCGSQSSKGECYRKKRLLLNIAFGLSSRNVRVGQGKNEGDLVTQSLSAKEYVTCVMRMQKYFATCFHLSESHKLSESL